jgi:hypothetical protein
VAAVAARWFRAMALRRRCHEKRSVGVPDATPRELKAASSNGRARTTGPMMELLSAEMGRSIAQRRSDRRSPERPNWVIWPPGSSSRLLRVV